MKKIFSLLLLLSAPVIWAQTYNMNTSNVSTCSGNFYDAGGVSGNYGNNQNFTMTFCPSTPGSSININFSAFNLENNADFLFVYDGNSIAAPLFGSFTGTASPGIVQATGGNPSGCITIRFVSDGQNTASGWAAAVSCVTPCQTINAVLDSTVPAANADGLIQICQGQSVTFNGNGTFGNSGAGATYAWNFDDGTTGTGQSVTHAFSAPGVYRVNLVITDPNNCRNNNLLNQVVQVSTTPQFNFSADPPQICYGYTSDITATVTPTPFNYQCTPPVSGTTFLPDGSGASYSTSIVVDCFDSNQTLTNMNQLLSVCLNMEHSYLGDLNISLVSPSGQTVILKAYPGGGGTYLGNPLDDPAVGPGTGFNYCFSMSGATTLVNGPTVPSGTPAGNAIAAGTYLPAGTFNSLVGSPLNGTWTIVVVDNLGIDNGYIFSWGLTFDPNLIPGDLSFTPSIVSQNWVPNPDIVSTSGTTATVQPATAGTHCYDYTVTDSFGCVYTATTCVEMLDEFPLEDPEDLYICGDGLFDLTQNIPIMLNGIGPNEYSILFHHSLQDAQFVADNIDPANAYDGYDGEIIYVSIEDLLTGSACIETRQFVLHENALPEATLMASATSACIGAPAPVVTFSGTDGLPPYTFTYDINGGAAQTEVSDAAGNASVTIPTTTAGSYTINLLDVADATCNQAQTESVTVTITQGPEAVIQAPVLTACMNGPAPQVTLTGSLGVPPYTYTYSITPGGIGTVVSDAAGVAVVSIPTGTAGTFSFDLIDIGDANCTNPQNDNAVFTIKDLPQSSVATSASTVCLNGAEPTITFTGSSSVAPYTFDYDIDGVPYTITTTSGNSATTTLPTTVTGTHTITITNVSANGCSQAQNESVSVLVNALPTAAANAPVLVACVNDPALQVSFSGAGGTAPYTFDYLYNGTPQTIVSDAAGVAVVPVPTTAAGTTTVDLTGVSDANCSGPASGQFVFTVNPLSEATMASDVSSVCYNGTAPVVTFTGSNGTAPYTFDYTINGAAGSVISVGNTATITLPTNVIGDQIVNLLSVSDGNCSNVQDDTLTVTVNALPTATIVADVTAVCQNAASPQITFTGSGGVSPYTFSYLLDGAPMTVSSAAGSDSVTISAPTGVVGIFTYDLTDVTDVSATACSQAQSGTVTITVNALPTAQISVSANSVCENGVEPVVTFTGNDGVAPYTFNYTLNGVAYSVTTTSGNTVTVQVPTTNSGTFDYQLVSVSESGATSCDQNQSGGVQVTVNPLPLAQIAFSTNAACLDAIAQPQVSFTGSNGTAPYTFSYTINSGPVQTIQSTVANDTVSFPISTATAMSYTIDLISVSDSAAPSCSQAVNVSGTVTIIAPPTPVVPSDLRLCDDNADGFQCFDLTASAGQVTGGDPDLSVRFYLTATDAATGSANFIADPSSYCTIVPGHQTLYIREWNVNAPSCAAVTTLELYVDPRPFALPDIPDYRLCDVNAPSGSEEFTLSSHIPYIVSDPTGLTVSFHASQADALLGTPSLPDLYTSSGEVVWVRLENAAGCVDVASFPLVVDALPVVATPLAPRTECIDTATGLASFNLASYINGISQGIPGVSVSFYASQADADVPQSPLPSPYQSAGGTVIVRLDNAECHVTAPLQLVGAVGPAVTAPSPIAVCDDNNDCFSTFDLTQAEQEIWGGPVPPGVAFAYYLTATDAQQQSANAIASPAAYANIVPCSQTLYVSVTDGAGTCPSVVPLEIQVIPIPEADEDVDPYALCDDDGDGQAYFDLTTLDGQVLGGMDASTHTVSYYATFADIAAGNPIVGVAAYLSPTATIWAVVGSTLTPCTDAVEIELVVDPQPSVSPIPAYRLCDDDFDQHASFDLDGYVGTILGGQTGLTVSFYHTQAEALSGTVGALSSPHVNEPAGSEFIWVRVENSLGCATVTGMDIVVDPLPVPYPVPADSPLLNACDVNTDGIATFDLAAIADFMQENVPATQMVIGFYLTALDAQLDQSPITGPSYTNVVPYTQTIYAGVHNPGTPGDCRSVWPVTLNVLPSAQPAGPLGPLTVCDGDQDGLAVFDLTGHEAEILAAQVGAGPYTVSYYTSQAAAGIGSPSILNPLAYANTSNPQQIWYRVEQPSGDCAATGSFLIQVDLPLALPASLPGIWSVCAPAAGVQSVEWDLTLIQAEIPGLTAGYAVEYYTTLADAQSGSGVNQILTPQAYTNVQNPQNIFLSVRDLATGCIAATYKDIQVIPLPEPRALQPSMALLVECEQNNGGTAFFDLSANQAYMANGSTDMAFEYYDNLADAQAGNSANAIPAADLSVYESAGGVVYIRVERNPGNTDVDGEYCYVIVEITLQVNPQPVLATGVALNRCELAGASTASFDLTEANAPLVAPAAASGYSFSYLDGTTPIPAASATAYTNTSNPQVVTVVVRDLATGCESTGSFTLNVKAGATAQPYAFAPVCDTDTDGLSVVDLTQADATVLGGQAPPQFGVAYYASLADVASGTPIADPSSFTTGTATVYAVVSNYGTGATPDPDPCTSGPQPVTITVEPLVAVSVSSPDDTICIDYATGAVIGAPTLTATPSDAASYTYQWLLDGVDTGVSTPTILADLPGTYTVNVQSLSAAGCVSGPSAGFQVVESSAPEFLAQAYTVTNAFQDHQSVQVHVQGQNAQLFEYSLDGGPWLANGGLFQDVAPGEHTVLVRSACSTTDPLTVILINYPHYFTPNGDGYHDTWNTLGLANDGMTKIYIFDRYGKLIKQIAPEIHGYDGWDGTYNGSPMPSTDYWFLVEYPDPETGTIKEFRSHFSLKR